MQNRIIFDAKTVILRHKTTPGEYRLNNYLIEQYGLDLKAACLYLVTKAKFYKDLSNSLTILFPEEKDDKLATYGNQTIKGSNLLKYAFFRD